MKLTYQQLLERLQALPPERLADNVTIHDDSLLYEFLPAKGTDFQKGDDILDDGHFYIVV